MPLSETEREPFEKLLTEWADKAHNAPTGLEAHRVIACMTDLRNLLDKIPGPHAGSDGGPPPAVAQGTVHDAVAEDGERGGGFPAAVAPLAVEPEHTFTVPSGDTFTVPTSPLVAGNRSDPAAPSLDREPT